MDGQAADFSVVDFAMSLADYTHYRHAAHAMIFARTNRVMWAEKIPLIANVMMQVRFDGALGFPGGLLDSTTEEPVKGLARELVEEIGLANGACELEQSDHLVTHVCHQRQLVTHFYVKELSEHTYLAIERGVLEAHDWGEETMGILRVPLFTLTDGRRGLPNFLTNRFAGNAREQLCLGLIRCNILSAHSLDLALTAPAAPESL